MDIYGYLKYRLPFKLKREVSFISLLFSFVFIYILHGFLAELGAKILNWLLPPKTPFVPEIFETIRLVATYPIHINLLTIFVFIILFYFLSHSFGKLNIRGIPVFKDYFDFGNKGWRLNYWGSNDPDKTCRFEKSNMVFEAEDSDLVSPQKENGACLDLTDGIYQGSKYEIYCWVKSSKYTTMGFKLWVHDTLGQAEMKSSPNFHTPTSEYKEVSVQFIATKSQALRIHLHYKAGKGSIYVDKVKVVKIS